MSASATAASARRDSIARFAHRPDRHPPPPGHDLLGAMTAETGPHEARVNRRSVVGIVWEQVRGGINRLLALAGALTFAIGDPTAGANIPVLLGLKLG